VRAFVYMTLICFNKGKQRNITVRYNHNSTGSQSVLLINVWYVVFLSFFKPTRAEICSGISNGT
jgi:hypothetical protein